MEHTGPKPYAVGGEQLTPSGRYALLAIHQAALLELARVEGRCQTKEAAIQAIAEVVSRTLDVDRASIWLYDGGRSRIECADLFLQGTGTHERGTVLYAEAYPEYFAALDEDRTIAANDARTDPRTHEFRVGYLEPLGITSMLDAPIRRHGGVAGVVCLEHVGEPRIWIYEEQNFAGSIADMVALTLEHFDRVQVEAELRERETLLDGVAKAANKMFAEAEAAIRYRDELLAAAAEASVAASSGLDSAATVGRILALVGEAARLDRVRLYEHGLARVAGDVALEERARWRREGGHWREEEVEAGASLTAPVRVGGELWGYLELAHGQIGREWTPAEESFFTVVAATVGATLGE
jgi:GAF domain-containing protein